jgi:hypothetical protein
MSETPLSHATRPLSRENERREPWLDVVRQSLRGLEHGSVVLIVQDGLVVQVDRTEKRRLRRPKGR